MQAWSKGYLPADQVGRAFQDEYKPYQAERGYKSYEVERDDGYRVRQLEARLHDKEIQIGELERALDSRRVEIARMGSQMRELEDRIKGMINDDIMQACCIPPGANAE